MAPGQYVLLSVTDTGTGISPEHLSKVFEPFFTTKSASMRTGLGLAMIYGFVKQSKGHIRIYSEVGHGTTAKIYLPRMIGAARAESVPAAARGESAQSPTARPGEVVLMVEDDEDVLEFDRHLAARIGLFGPRRPQRRRSARAASRERRESTSCSPMSFFRRA